MAQHADARGVDVGAGFEIIERADEIPHAVIGERAAEEQGGAAGQHVLGGGAGRLLAGLGEHPTLALAHGVENERDETFPREADAGALVIGRGLALTVMAA